jgi:hypothetical protein
VQKKQNKIILRPGAVVRPKLAINSPGDRYEREADAMAEQVVSGGASASSSGAARAWDGMIAGSIQRKCAKCEEEKKTKVMRKGESRGGRQLLAHELTHVVQQGGHAGVSPAVQRAPDDNQSFQLSEPKLQVPRHSAGNFLRGSLEAVISE